ncbi:MAG TPA: hypothetical protein VJN71_09890 [Nitrososphaerales archaeon]|nr:hypothetical protein [Nitrososphaerales archaeon]
MALQFLPNLPTTGTSPLTAYSEILEIAFIFGGALLSIIVLLIDPIYPKSVKTKKLNKDQET